MNKFELGPYTRKSLSNYDDVRALVKDYLPVSILFSKKIEGGELFYYRYEGRTNVIWQTKSHKWAFSCVSDQIPVIPFKKNLFLSHVVLVADTVMEAAYASVAYTYADFDRTKLVSLLLKPD